MCTLRNELFLISVRINIDDANITNIEIFPHILRLAHYLEALLFKLGIPTVYMKLLY